MGSIYIAEAYALSVMAVRLTYLKETHAVLPSPGYLVTAQLDIAKHVILQFPKSRVISMLYSHQLRMSGRVVQGFASMARYRAQHRQIDVPSKSYRAPSRCKWHIHWP